MSSISALGRSPWGGNGNPLQYSCLGNAIDRGAWQSAVLGGTKNQTRLSTARIYNYVIDKQRYFCLFSSNSAAFISFSCLTAPPRTSSTVLNASGRSTSCLVPDLRGKYPSSPPWVWSELWIFHRCCLSGWVFLTSEVVGFFPGVFSVSVDMLVFCWCVVSLNGFHLLNHPCIPGINHSYDVYLF